MEPLITKADFPPIVRVSLNVKDSEINPHIEDATLYDLPNKLPSTLLLALLELPAVPADPETQPELRAFYNKYLKRYLVLISYIRFISEHGINITQFSVTKTKDPQGTFDQATDGERSRIIRNKTSDANTTLAMMNTYLGDVKYKIDGVYYGSNQTPAKPSIGISAIRAKDENITYRTYLNRFL
jgi:hypothetical protein